MTLEEAQKVLDICTEADGGCSDCAWHLVHLLEDAFPQFNWNYNGKIWDQKEIKVTLKDEG